MKLVLFQLIIALSFGLRFVGAQRWPWTGHELDLLDSKWIHHTPWNELQDLSLWRWLQILLFLIVVLLWNAQLKDRNDKRFSSLPLILLHLFPIGLWMGTAVDLSLIALLVFWFQFQHLQEGTFSSKKAGFHIVLSILMAIVYLPSLMFAPCLLFIASRKAITSSASFKLKCSAIALGIVGLLLNTQEQSFYWIESLERLNALLGQIGLIFCLLLLLISTIKIMLSDRPLEHLHPWYWILIPSFAMSLCATEHFNTYLFMALLALLAISHELYLKWPQSPLHSMAIIALLAYGNWNPSSQNFQHWKQEALLLHQYRQLAEKWDDITQNKPGIILCSDPQLLNYLKAYQDKPCLLYPASGPNASYRHLNQPGFWVRTERHKELPTPHLSQKKSWIQLDVQRGDHKLPITIETFQELSLPF